MRLNELIETLQTKCAPDLDREVRFVMEFEQCVDAEKDKWKMTNCRPSKISIDAIHPKVIEITVTE